MKYKCFKEFNGKSLNRKPLSVPIGAELIRYGDVLFYEGLPVCTWRSQVAKTYLVWNENNDFEERLSYLNTIVFSERSRSWVDPVQEYDEDGNVTGSHLETFTDRYTPAEVDYMMNKFPQFFDDNWRFNDYFYTGSKIEELRELSDYLNRK